MASGLHLNLNDPHPPRQNALQAFHVVERQIKQAVLKSRHDWDKHEPKMWARASSLSDKQLVGFNLKADLVQVRSAPTSYGTIILGKIRIPAVHDAQGEGFIHVRIHDPPNRGTEDVTFHSLFTDEGNKNAAGHPTTWQAIQSASTPLEFFNE